jgi:hypothetical protein
VEDFLVYRWDWRDLKAFLHQGPNNRLLWITECTFLVAEDWNDTGIYVFNDHDYFAADIRAAKGEALALLLVEPYQSDKFTAEPCVFWRAMATSNSVHCHKEHLHAMATSNRQYPLSQGTSACDHPYS